MYKTTKGRDRLVEASEPMKTTRPKAQSPKEALKKASKMTDELAAQGLFKAAKKPAPMKPIKTTDFLHQMAQAVSKPKKAKKVNK